jgi:hypothetical protein
MKKLLVFVTACLLTLNGICQDIITKKDGSEILAKVLEVGTADVKYKKFDNVQGPTYTILKSEIFMIKYENGGKDVFTTGSNSSTNQNNEGNQTSVGASNLNSSTFVKTGNFYLGIAIPTGDFASKDNGGAKTGFLIGYDYMYGNNFFKLVWNPSIGYNSGKYESGYDSYSYGFLSNYENVGFRLQGGSDNFKFYGLLLGGLTYTLPTGDLDDYGAAYTFDYTIGAGCVINKHLNIGLRYCGYKPTFSYSSDGEDYEFTQKISILNFTVGLEF